VPAGGLVVAHLPMVVIEGLVTAQVAVFLRKVRPELLEAPVLPPVQEQAVGT
jgi:ABC-type Co2+ transport system permease subunit